MNEPTTDLISYMDKRRKKVNKLRTMLKETLDSWCMGRIVSKTALLECIKIAEYLGADKDD